MKDSIMEMISSGSAGFFALAGALIGGAGSVIGIWLTKRYEERRERRALATEIALKNWEFVCDSARRSVGIGDTTHLPPLDPFVLHAVALTDLMEKRGLSLQELREEIRKIKGLVDVAMDEVKDRGVGSGRNREAPRE